jgi:ERCC4-type nuclease
MLISPAEPHIFYTLGKVSSLPETYGADFLIHSPHLGLVGVQRKTIPDLVASIQDGRVARELIDQKRLGHAVWLIEGRPSWNSDDELMSVRTRYTRHQHLSVMLSLCLEGSWMISSEGTADSMRLLSDLNAWVMKEEHLSLKRRPGPTVPLGSLDPSDWQTHLLMGFPGLGYKTARAILNHFGRSPLILDPTLNLTDVPGVGAKTVARMVKMLGGGSDERGGTVLMPDDPDLKR